MFSLAVRLDIFRPVFFMVRVRRRPINGVGRRRMDRAQTLQQILIKWLRKHLLTYGW